MSARSERARSRALRLLGRREYSAKEIADRIGAKEPDMPEFEIAELLESLQSLDMQSDARCASVELAAQLRKGRGPLYCRGKLQSRGLDEAVYAPLLEPIDWLERCIQQYTKLDNHYNNSEKVAAKLQRMGYPVGMILSAGRHISAT